MAVRPIRYTHSDTAATTAVISASTAAEPAATASRARRLRSAHSSAAPVSPIHSRNIEVRTRSVQKSTAVFWRASVSTSAVSSTISTMASVVREVQKSGR